MMNNTLYLVKNEEGAFVGSMNVPSGTNNHSAGINWFDALLHNVPVPVVNGRKVVNQVAFDKMLERNPGEVLDFHNISFENVKFPLGMEHLFKDNIYSGCYLGNNAIETLGETSVVPCVTKSVIMA